ncbi:MAG: Uma2 family endonuclease [Acidobacteria bacterium]|nr:Uma2 family endonuclease [Acidobacteriota bacterium]
MPIVVAEPLETLAVESLPRKTWTRAELKLLESTGVFDGQHYELIEGELINKMGKSRPHVVGVRRAARALEAVFGEEYVEREAPVDVAPGDNPRNEPELDVFVLRRPFSAYTSNPQPGDVIVAMEASGTTLLHDRTTKARLYARAGIPEYWVLDLAGRRLLVFREPGETGYGVQLSFSEFESVCPLERPTHLVPVASLLPPSASAL